MKTTITIIIGAVLVTGSVFILSKDRNESAAVVPQASGEKPLSGTESSAPQSTNPTAVKTNTSVVAVPTSPSYSMAQVSAHNSVASCWAVVSGSVYDLTSWISKHPGGEQAIKSICGKDGTEEFSEQHSGEKKPNDILKTFKIGVLAR